MDKVERSSHVDPALDILTSIDAILAETAWMVRGACFEKGTDDWFPDQENPTWSAQSRAKMAKRMCQGCVVRKDCGDYADRYDIQDGIWGGVLRDTSDRVEPMEEMEVQGQWSLEDEEQDTIRPGAIMSQPAGRMQTPWGNGPNIRPIPPSTCLQADRESDEDDF